MIEYKLEDKKLFSDHASLLFRKVVMLIFISYKAPSLLSFFFFSNYLSNSLIFCLSSSIYFFCS